VLHAVAQRRHVVDGGKAGGFSPRVRSACAGTTLPIQLERSIDSNYEHAGSVIAAMMTQTFEATILGRIFSAPISPTGFSRSYAIARGQIFIFKIMEMEPMSGVEPLTY
jgi:hypothetical protein